MGRSAQAINSRLQLQRPADHLRRLAKRPQEGPTHTFWVTEAGLPCDDVD